MKKERKREKYVRHRVIHADELERRISPGTVQYWLVSMYDTIVGLSSSLCFKLKARERENDVTPCDTCRATDNPENYTALT